MSFENLPNHDLLINNNDFKEIIPELKDNAIELGFDMDNMAIKNCLEVLSQYTDPEQAKEDLKKIWEAMTVESGPESDLDQFNESDNF